MGVFLAALSALMYGTADFMGGLASRRESPLAVTWFGQMVGLVTIVVAAVIVPASLVTFADFVWGATAGSFGVIGLLLLYTALGTGPMAIVAPITAACSAAVPVIAGLISGDRPSLVAGLGIGLALPAIILVASSPVQGEGIDGTPARISQKVLMMSVASGVMFGTYFAVMARAGEGSGLWPTVGARIGSVFLLALVVLVQLWPRSGVVASPGWRQAWSAFVPGRDTFRLVVASGLFDVAANAAFLLASRRGLLSIISVISAMYPAATVGLARVVLQERFGRVQIFGLALTALAVALVAL